MQRARTEERKRIEKEKLAITTRHRILATILGRVNVPLKKGDLLVVAQYLIDRLPHTQVSVLAKRHKLDVEKPGQVPQQIIAKHVGTYDEEGLCRMLLEISLLDSAYQRNCSSGDDSLLSTARRYRVDAEKIGTAVARELAKKKEKREAVTSSKPKQTRKQTVA